MARRRPPPIDEDDHWRFDRRINLSVIGALVLFIGGYFVLNYRVGALEDAVKDLHATHDQIINLSNSVTNLGDKLKDSSQALSNDLQDVKRLVVAQFPTSPAPVLPVPATASPPPRRGPP